MGTTYWTVDLSAATVPADGVLVVATQTVAGEVLAARDLIGSVDWQNGPAIPVPWIRRQLCRFQRAGGRPNAGIDRCCGVVVTLPDTVAAG